MVDPASGPFLFDTSAESWLTRSEDPAVGRWLSAYLSSHSLRISAVTVLERMRGYGSLLARSLPDRRAVIHAAREAYLRDLDRAFPVSAAIAVVAAELMALVPDPPTPPRRSHRRVEARTERLVRWRFDIVIAATAMVSGMSLVHNNPADFEAIRAAIEVSPQRFPGLGPLELIRCPRLA